MASASPFERLPMEIVDQIIKQVEGPKAALSTISRSWQAAIEKETFSSIKFTSDGDSFKCFDFVFSNEGNTSRRSFLKSLTYKIMLEPVSAKRLRKLQNKAERARNNRVFTQALVRLAERLTGWAHHGRGIHLILHVDCLTDHESKHTPLHAYRGSQIETVRNDLAYIELDEAVASAFPLIASITRFSLWRFERRLIHPETFLALFNCMPNLADVDWEVHLPERRQPVERRLIRNAFGRLLQEAPFHCLRTCRVFCTEYEAMNERYTLDDFTDENGDDSVSLGVRRLLNLPTLQTLHLNEAIALSPAAFTDIHSPSLKNVEISLSAVTPDGNWYFTGDPENPGYEESDRGSEYDGSERGFDSDNSSQSDDCPEYAWLRESGDRPQFFFRLVPDDKTFGPLVASIARAIQSGMPSLQRMEVALGTCLAQVRVEMSFYTADERKRHSEHDIREFHERQAGKPRCVIYVWGDIENVEWKMGPQAEEALADVYDDDCIFIKLRQR